MLLVNAVNTEGRPLEIFVKDGRIAAVGQELEALAGENETVIDAGGLTVLPAFVDLHCHWRTPGFEYKEDIETGSRAAAAGAGPVAAPATGVCGARGQTAGQGGNGRQQRQRLPFIIDVTQCSSPFRDSALDCVGAGIAIPDRYHCNPVSRTPVWTFAQETGKGRPTDVRGTALKEKRSRPA